MEFWTTSRIIMLRDSVSMLQEVYKHFQSITAQMASFQEQITQLRGGKVFLKCYKRKKLLSEWGFYKMNVATDFFYKEEKYADCNQCILRIADDFPNCQRFDYLRSIAHLAYQLLCQLYLFIIFFSHRLGKPFLFKVDL